MKKRTVKRLVAYCIGITALTDPFEIARQMKIQVQFGPLGEYAGCYLFAKNHRCIFINDCLEDTELLLS